MKKIVFTNGCFDIIHRGHIEYLIDAKKKGDYLIIGLNSDLSVKKIKGDDRPINSESDRSFVLLSLACVDKVIIYDEPDPLKLIETIKPNVLVKGGDWAVEDIIGSEFVLKRGGSVYSLCFKDEYSTTKIIEKIKNIYRD